MQKKNTKYKVKKILGNSTLELLLWPTSTLTSKAIVQNKIIAIQTTRFIPDHNNSNQDISPFHGFNLGLHVHDDIASVELNREYLQYEIEITAENKVVIQWLEQVHGNDVVEIIEPSNKALVADASITRNKNIALAIMTADCLPILLCNSKKTEIAAIHGGWRPLMANIIEKTIAKMKSNVADIEVWLGPCIGPSAFEVGEEVKQAFTKQNPDFATAFVLQSNKRYLANLHTIAKMQLSALNVREISELNECTYHLSNKYYSYRREPITGRMASVICISD